jgi:hypothetical protein
MVNAAGVNIRPRKGDANTGLQNVGDDRLALVSGGIQAITLIEASSAVYQQHQTNVGITAFATGGQTSATQLNSSYNVVSTVATTGDSVKFSPTLEVGIIVYVKNDGANAMDLFPAGGDDLGFGVGVAVSVPAGASVAFIGSVISSTWTQLIFAAGGGGGIAAVVDDPSPQLGGDLDTNGSNILNADTTLTSIAITAGTDPAVDGGDLDLSSGDSGVGATGTGGAVNILAGESLATAGDGGVVSIKSGAGILSGAGGDILVEVGTGGAAGPGTSGRFFVNTTTGANAAAGLQVPLPGLTAIYGVGRSGAGLAGNLELWGGYASGAGGGSIGGNLMLFGGGQGGGSGEGGNAILVGGESDTQPGDARMVGGVATSAGIGGAATVTGGAAAGVNNSGGSVQVTGGLGIGTGIGGQANLIGGGSGSGATGNGGNAEVVGGASNATAGDGGAVTIQSGAGNGAGVDGDINFKLGSAIEFFITDGPNGEFFALDGGGPALRNRPTSETVPTFVPNRADLDTGIGSAQVDNLSLIAGGVQGLRLAEASGGIIFQPDADLAITAFATGGQGNLFLTKSYNVLSVVATTGDSVTLPAVFRVNSLVFIKNDGVNAADVFPASGDDLGAGLNTAISLAAGESASFIGVTQNLTWTPWIVSAGGGGGDVTKVGTPVNNQIGVWTGDGTIEGDANLIWDGSKLDITTGRIELPGGSAAAPPIGFQIDTGTGIYRVGNNNFGIASGGLHSVNWLRQTGQIIQTNSLHTGLTASTTQTQGQGALFSSYNVVSTVANANDVVTAMVAVAGKRLTIYNDGANILQVFPSLSDDIGAGVNSSITIAVGASKSWIANDSVTWLLIGSAP